MRARGFVRAVLAPHDREHAKLDEIRRAPEQHFDAGVFFVRKSVLADDLGRNVASSNHDSDSSRLSNSARPSVPPSSGSQTRSGCGISPSTLRLSFKMPAILRTDPLGLWSSA